MSTTKASEPLAFPIKREDVKILLLEGVNATGVESLRNAGFTVECHEKALTADRLAEKIKDVHVVGIRSKTLLSADILTRAKNLLAIGCFCIGTNQVDLEYTASRGICVFNSPFSNSRSVAELVLAEVIALSRQLADYNSAMHQGASGNAPVSQESALTSHEVRGKTLGIIGYGHIGSQLSVLADALGMRVVFYDILPIMPLGTAKPLSSMRELLQVADFVTLHVPETEETCNMIGAGELQLMRRGSFLINASRGSVVVIQDLVEALRSGHLAGAAVDVYPAEPYKNGPGFETPLMGCPNTILTPHIGGSTEEAQAAIGAEVGETLIRYLTAGSSMGAVNFPEVDIRPTSGRSGGKVVRILNCHRNVPGVLKKINRILSEFNIEKQTCDSRGNLAYLIAEMRLEDSHDADAVCKSIACISENIMTRVV